MKYHYRGNRVSIKNMLAVAAALLLVSAMASVTSSAKAATAPSPPIPLPKEKGGEGGKGACNCVIFRLDDIQDDWMNAVQAALMDHFIEKNEKLTVGVIMNLVGNDSSVVDRVRAGLSSGTFEIASHAWNHVDYRTLTPKEQHDTLRQANQKMDALWGTHAVVFIPPYNAYNEDTLAALQALGIKIISAEFSEELASVYDQDNPDSPGNMIFKAMPGSNIADSHGIYHLPQAVGFYTYDTPIPTKTSMMTMMNDINSAIASYGYAVVTLHPEDFAVKDADHNPANKVSSSELADLDALIHNIHEKGYVIKNYSKVAGVSPPEEMAAIEVQSGSKPPAAAE